MWALHSGNAAAFQAEVSSSILGARTNFSPHHPALRKEHASMNNVLVLNFTYEPLNVTRVARAVRLVFAGKAEIVHKHGTIASPITRRLHVWLLRRTRRRRDDDGRPRHPAAPRRAFGLGQSRLGLQPL